MPIVWGRYGFGWGLSLVGVAIVGVGFASLVTSGRDHASEVIAPVGSDSPEDSGRGEA